MQYYEQQTEATKQHIKAHASSNSSSSSGRAMKNNIITGILKIIMTDCSRSRRIRNRESRTRLGNKINEEEKLENWWLELEFSGLVWNQPLSCTDDAPACKTPFQKLNKTLQAVW